jgi:predicted DNA-binding transcriptional regulator YafY
VPRGSLVGLQEIADMFGVSTRTARRYTERDSFPAPLDVLAGGRRIYDRATVDQWGREHLPLPRGRRPGEPS